jgi:SAM-dependent methyltransferase
LPEKLDKRHLREASTGEKESFDVLTEYVKPLFLDKIAARIDSGILDGDADLQMINDDLKRRDTRKTWQGGFDSEARHWTHYLLNRVKTEPAERYRLDPDLALAPELGERLGTLIAGAPRVLDVGAGPLTTVGKKWRGQTIALTAVDPLAEIYDKVLAEVGIDPMVRTIRGEGEDLSALFGENSFDLVYCANALDHFYNPFKALEEMLRVVKKGGWVLLNHFPNEAETEQYSGFHQWNLWGHNGRFIIWNRARVYDASLIFRPYAEITAAEKNGILFVYVHKV